jgi:hypothetical protein
MQPSGATLCLFSPSRPSGTTLTKNHSNSIS